MFYLALVMIAVIALITVTATALPIRIKSSGFICIWLVYVLGMSIIAYYIEPSPSLDLYRIYQEIDAFRSGSRTIFDSPMIILNLVYWLVSKTNYNGWYSFISVLLTGLLQLNVIRNYIKNNEYSSRAICLSFLACNSGCFVVYLFIGRSSFVAALFVYAYYIWHGKNRKVFWILMLCGSLIHTLGLILSLLTIVYDISFIKKSKRMYILTFTIVLAMGYVLQSDFSFLILERIGTGYGQMLSEKWRAYSIRGIEFQQQQEMMFRFISTFFLLISVLYLHYKKDSTYDLFAYFVMVMYAGFNISIIFERMPYVVCMASLPILNETFMKMKRGRLLYLYIGAMIFLMVNVWGLYEASLWLDFRI